EPAGNDSAAFPRPTRQRWWAPFGQPAPDSDQPPRSRAPAACLSWSRPLGLTGSRIATGVPDRAEFVCAAKALITTAPARLAASPKRSGRRGLVHDVPGHVGGSTRQLRGLQASGRAGKAAHTLCPSWPLKRAASERRHALSRRVGAVGCLEHTRDPSRFPRSRTTTRGMVTRDPLTPCTGVQ